MPLPFLTWCTPHPRRLFSGTVSLNYTVRDGVYPGNATARVTLLVAPAGSMSPVKFNYSLPYNSPPFQPGTPRQLLLQGLTSTNPNPRFSVVGLTKPPPASAGSVVVAPDGNFTFSVAPGWYGTTVFCANVTDGHGAFATSCVDIVVEKPDWPLVCRCAPYSGGSLAEFLSTSCTSPGANFSYFQATAECTPTGLEQSQRPLGCWLRDADNWKALVTAQAQRGGGEPPLPEGGVYALSFTAGNYTVRFTLNGVLCMSSWFDLNQLYPAGALAQNFTVDGRPGACGSPPPLDKLGGSMLLTVLATELNLLRDTVLQSGENLKTSVTPHPLIIAGGCASQCLIATYALLATTPAARD